MSNIRLFFRLQIDQWHDCFAEHNYFSPSKESKPEIAASSETSVSTSENSVPSATSASACVPVVTQDYVVETEISSSASSLELKTPRIVLSQCSSKTASSKGAKVAKKLDTTKKPKKPVLPKAMLSKSFKNDPTYKPHTKKPLPKKILPKSKPDFKPSKSVAQQLFASNCNIAKLPRIPMKSSSCEDKLNNRICVVKPRISPSIAPKAPSIAPQAPSIARQAPLIIPMSFSLSPFIGEVDRSPISNNSVSVFEPDPVDMANPRTPLASPTKDDFKDHDEFTNQDSSQPETINSNVDMSIDPIQPVEDPTPKMEKKKISLQEYLQKRSTEIKPNQENDSFAIEEAEPIVTRAPVPNIEDILRTIVKPKVPPIDDVQKPVKSEPSPAIHAVKSEPSRHKSVPKSRHDPIGKQSRPKIDQSVSKPRREPIESKQSRPKMDQSVSKPRHDPTTESVPQPRRDPTTESNPSRPKVDQSIAKPQDPPKEPENNTPLKLVKVAVPERTPSVRSYSLSPNEVSQSLDSCDRCSSSGVSSYQNSSVSSMCGSPFTVHDDKSNDTKYFDNGKSRIEACFTR